MTDVRNPAPHIVGVGASAGGLEAIEQFFRCIPMDSGAAYVVVQHLSPDFRSLMDELLARSTQVPIRRAESGLVLEPDTITLNLPGNDLVVEDGRILLSKRREGLHLPIDRFFGSLARDAGPRAVAIVLSGTGSDGSRGVVEVDAAGGLVMVQEPDSARFDGMPRAVLATGTPAESAPPEALAGALLRHLGHADAPARPAPDLGAVDDLQTLLALLRSRSGIDFTAYKSGTVARRIGRRMQARSIEGLDGYLDVLRSDPDELDLLHRDLLIGVTAFFRDPEAYDRLARDVLPGLVREAEGSLRIWSAATSTGAEAFSLAMLLVEEMERQERTVPTKIFATDVHRRALESAGNGLFSEADLEGVSAQRRARFFTRMGEAEYRVSADLRALCVFAPHDLLRDPPFTRIDLIVCRNVLIYLKPQQQQRVLGSFHFALRKDAALFLGSSESVGSLGGEFEVVDSRWKLYRKRRDVPLRGLPGTDFTMSGRRPDLVRRLDVVAAPTTVQRAYDLLLDRFVPPSLLLSPFREVVHSFGDASRFLKPPGGRMSLDVMKLVSGELRTALGTALHRASRDAEEVVYVGVRSESAGGAESLRVSVAPLKAAGHSEPFYLATLEPVAAAVRAEPRSGEPAPAVADEGRIEALERELQYVREHLQATIEELETSNEELQATNEELVAANEELQSTNEELHSVNEELHTVNAEHQRKIEELTDLTADMDNLLRSTRIGTIFLESELRIRRYTPEAAAVFNLLDQDLGRPLSHFASTLTLHGRPLDALVADVVGGAEVREAEGRVGAQELLVRVLPYVQGDGKRAGTVITLVDVTNLQHAHAQLAASEERFKKFADEMPEILWVAPPNQQALWVNVAYERLMGRSREALAADPADWMHAVHPDDQEAMMAAWMAEDGEPLNQDFRVVRPDGSSRYMILRGWTDPSSGFRYGLAEDVTAQRLHQEFLEALVEGLPDATLIVDASGTIVRVNARAEEVLGADREDLVGSAPERFVPELMRREHVIARQGYHAAPTRRQMGRSGLTAVAADGREFPVDVSLGPVPTEQGMLVVASLRDLTAQAAMQRRLDESNAQLARAQKLDAIGQLAGGLAHEFNNVLQAVMLHLSSASAADTDAGREEGLRAANRAARRATRLTSGLLGFSRQGPAGPTRAVDPSRVIQGLTDLIAPLLGAGVRLDVRVPDALPMVLAVPDQLTQVLLNLCLNARDAMTPGGGAIRLAAVEEEDEVCFTVSDEGPGVPEEIAGRIFEPFFTTKEVGKGTGLGLAVAYGMITQMGGRLELVSEPGEGACFTICLPLAEDDSDESGEEAPGVGGEETILVAEDDELVRRGLARLLQRKGYTVIEAVDGLDALDRFRAEAAAIALVIADLRMPRMSGRELHAALRQESPELPILFASGYDPDGSPLPRGRTGSVQKPFAEAELLGAIRALLDG